VHTLLGVNPDKTVNVAHGKQILKATFELTKRIKRFEAQTGRKFPFNADAFIALSPQDRLVWLNTPIDFLKDH
jgi:hypothetical protein